MRLTRLQSYQKISVNIIICKTPLSWLGASHFVSASKTEIKGKGIRYKQLYLDNNQD